MAVQGRAADAEGRADVGDGGRLVGVHRSGERHLLRIEKLRTSAHASAGACRRQSGQCALTDEVPLELSQRREKVEDELADPGGRVDALLKAPKPDPLVTQVVDEGDEMREGAAEPIELPHDQGVALPERRQPPLEPLTVSVKIFSSHC